MWWLSKHRKQRKHRACGYQAEVEIYTSRYCGYCYAAKEVLDDADASYREIACDQRPDLRQWLRQVSGQRTVPQIFINGVSIGGHLELAGLERDGTLEQLLRQAPEKVG